MRNPIITGERVYLRAEEPEDAAAHARFYAAETDDFTDDFGRYPMSPIKIDHIIREVHKSHPPKDISFASCLKENDDVIGRVGLSRVDYVNQTAESFSFFGPDWRGQGYGTESKFLLLNYAFNQLGLHVIQSHVWGANDRSAAALHRQGYRSAGRYRWDNTRRGVYHDILIFDVKRDEFLAARDEWRARYAARAGTGQR